MKTIKIGEEYLVELTSNPSTGYSWSFLPAKLEIVSIQQTTCEVDPYSIGATVKTIFKIKGEKKGTANITFFYHKAWEKNRIPAITKNIIVLVQ